jgi:hypothetical protein
MVIVGNRCNRVAFQPAQEMFDLRCGNSAAKPGFGFQIHKWSKQDTRAWVINTQEEVGAEGKTAEYIRFGLQCAEDRFGVGCDR